MPFECSPRKLVYGGDALGHYQGRPVLVPCTLPGERVEVEPVRTAKGVVHARPLRILEAAPERVDPPCPYFGRCGGCQYQHLEPARQADAKGEILRETLRRIGKIVWQGDVPVHAGPAWNYRNQARLKVASAPDGRVALGFFEAESHQLFPIDVCLILSPRLNAILGALLRPEWARPLTGCREIELLADDRDEHVMVTLHGRLGPLEAKALAGKVLRELPGVVSAVAEDGHDREIVGQPALAYRVGEFEYQVTAGSFFQASRFLLGELVVAVAGSESRPSVLGVLLFLLVYAALVEQRASTLRATIMITVYLLARLLYREYVALNGIGLAALLLLVHRPAWLFEAGFELSFSAALLIVALVVPILDQTTEPYRRALGRLSDLDLDAALTPRQAQLRLDLRDLVDLLRARLPLLAERPALSAALVTTPARVVLWAANILLFSAVLQLGLLLPMAETFHRVSYAGIGLNALAIPVMTLLLAAALPAVILAALAPALGPGLGAFLAPVMRILFALTDLPNLPEWLAYRVPTPPLGVAWGFALAAVAAGWSVRRHRRAFWSSLSALIAFALLISLYPFAPGLPRGALEMSALDCGGGQALFVVLPDRTTLLAGACGGQPRSQREIDFEARRWDPGEEIVSNYLWSRGVKKIDILLAADAHVAGLATVMRNFRVGEFWRGAGSWSPAVGTLLEQAGRSGVASRELRSGDLALRGDTSLRVLRPPAAAGAAAPNLGHADDESVILRITHDKASLLIAGDASDSSEHELARSAAPLKSDALAIAPRRLRPSVDAEFLARVSPRIVLWTGESDTRAGASSSKGLDQLRATGALVFPTNVEGAVTLKMKGTQLAVRTYRTWAGEGTAAASVGTTLSVP